MLTGITNSRANQIVGQRIQHVSRTLQTVMIIAIALFSMMALANVPKAEATMEGFAYCVEECRDSGGGPVKCFLRCSPHLLIGTGIGD